jgi:hypothetical protein
MTDGKLVGEAADLTCYESCVGNVCFAAVMEEPRVLGFVVTETIMVFVMGLSWVMLMYWESAEIDRLRTTSSFACTTCLTDRSCGRRNKHFDDAWRS